MKEILGGWWKDMSRDFLGPAPEILALIYTLPDEYRSVVIRIGCGCFIIIGAGCSFLAGASLVVINKLLTQTLPR